MYVRKVEGKELTFTVSGLLWRRSLVMQDEETSSQWSHLMGRAMAGELKGAEMKVIPSVMTDWKTWQSQHPGTDVLELSRTTRAFVVDVQKQPGLFTLGLRTGGAVADFPFDVLKRERVVSTMVGKLPVLVTFDAATATARAFGRKLKDGHVLEFRMENDQVEDVASGSVWDPATGVCIKGTSKGTTLTMLPGIPSYIRAWRIFYPASKAFSAPDGDSG